jgi:hypothetical protein
MMSGELEGIKEEVVVVYFMTVLKDIVYCEGPRQ